MQRPDIELGERGYEKEHVQTVLNTLKVNFPQYFDSFWTDAAAAKLAFSCPRIEWDKDKDAYVELLDIESLDEFDDDPNTFKTTLRRNCPIVRRCLNAKTDDMKDYKMKFNMATGHDLLKVTHNLALFAANYIEEFNNGEFSNIVDVNDLKFSDLQTAEYTAYGVIGGGIKSHFLYSLHPQAFPNRSQNSIWALYFLSDKRDFGFKDGSEFLMMHNAPKGAIIQHNYHYPYDLFSFYAINIYDWLEAACLVKGLTLDREFRFVHLDAFMNSISDKHREEIKLFKDTGDYEYAG